MESGPKDSGNAPREVELPSNQGNVRSLQSYRQEARPDCVWDKSLSSVDEGDKDIEGVILDFPSKEVMKPD